MVPNDMRAPGHRKRQVEGSLIYPGVRIWAPSLPLHTLVVTLMHIYSNRLRTSLETSELAYDAAMGPSDPILASCQSYSDNVDASKTQHANRVDYGYGFAIEKCLAVV